MAPWQLPADWGGLADQAQLFALLTCRSLGLCVTAPIFANRFVPVAVRLGLAAGVTAIVWPLLVTGSGRLEPAPWAQAVGAGEAGPALVIALGVSELLLGMVLGFVAALLFAAVQLAGELVDTDMGFAIARTVDPLSGVQLPLVGNLKYIFALLIFLSVDGHHLLLQAVRDSYLVIPLGGVVVGEAAVAHLVRMGGALFLTALAIAAPAVGALFLTSLALGVMARSVPQMNVFVVGLPLRILVGIFLLIVGLPAFAGALQGLMAGLYDDLAAMLYHLAP